MLDRTKIPFIQAAQFGSRNGETPGVIVLHTTESGDQPTGARAVANYFAGVDKPASAHYVVDMNEIIHCVQESEAADGAPGANADGIHIEHCGTAAWSAEDWQRPDVQQMLKLSADLVASICRSWEIDAVWLSAQQLANEGSGITSHANVTAAFRAEFPHASHTDPGPNFPVAQYIALVKAAQAAG